MTDLPLPNDEPLAPNAAALLADVVALSTRDLVAVSNGIMTHVHTREACEGRACWIHAPTRNWPLAGRPVLWSAERRMAYRLCDHDGAHPDIDAVAFATRYRTNYSGRETRPNDPEWHPECDGCCWD